MSRSDDGRRREAAEVAGHARLQDGPELMQPRKLRVCFGLVAIVAAWGVAAAVAPAFASNPIPGADEPMVGQSVLRPGKWCADFRLGQLSDEQRLSGKNLTRLKAAQAEVAPGFLAGRARTGLVLLADYQQESEKRHPDSSLLAMYLAMASAGPLTIEHVQRVNALLCVSMTRAYARSLVAGAEAARRQMAK